MMKKLLLSFINRGGGGAAMDEQFKSVLDQCIDRINEGESPDACLANYPDYAEELESLLSVLFDAKQTCAAIPESAAMEAIQYRLEIATAEIEDAPEKAWWKAF
jgi:hypothetical protein